MGMVGFRDFFSDHIISFFHSAENDDMVKTIFPTVSPVSLDGPFTFGVALGRYTLAQFHTKSDLGILIHLMKYGQNIAAAEKLAAFIIEYLKSYPLPETPDLLVTIPDTIPNRPFKANQYLGDHIAVALGIPSRHDIFGHLKLGPPQKDRSFEERLADDQPRYRLTHPEAVKGKSILLYDDICSTGQSLCEAARLLKSAGAESVTALTLVKIGPPRD